MVWCGVSGGRQGIVGGLKWRFAGFAAVSMFVLCALGPCRPRRMNQGSSSAGHHPTSNKLCLSHTTCPTPSICSRRPVHLDHPTSCFPPFFATSKLSCTILTGQWVSRLVLPAACKRTGARLRHPAAAAAAAEPSPQQRSSARGVARQAATKQGASLASTPACCLSAAHHLLHTAHCAPHTAVASTTASAS